MKKQILSITLILIGLSCFFAFHIIGSNIDNAGILHEKFALIPLGYLLIGIGLFSVIARLFIHIGKQYRSKKI
jgi:hypothetical protein